MATTLPPCYSEPLCCPAYSSLPSDTEEVLEYTPRPNHNHNVLLIEDTFRKQVGSITLILKSQSATAVFPSYGRNSVVSGEIELDDRDDVVTVVLKFQGQQHLYTSEGGTNTTSLVSDTYILWNHNGSPDHRCPALIPFSFLFPSSYRDGDHIRRLPPSYNADFLDHPFLFANCFYTLTVSINKSRRRSFAFWSTRKTLSLRVDHHPRTHPPRPPLPGISFLSTVKMSPEEWLEAMSEMPTRSKSGIQPVRCHFFIPSVQTFGLSDTIPFYVQLCGPFNSLRMLHPPESETNLSSGDPNSKTTEGYQKYPVRVSLLRQISVDIHGRKLWRNAILGEGQMHPLPPPVSEAMEETLNWEGCVRCNEKISTGGFRTNKLIVKDFIILTVTPLVTKKCPLLKHQYVHPVTLVTDSWVDNTLHPADR